MTIRAPNSFRDAKTQVILVNCSYHSQYLTKDPYPSYCEARDGKSASKEHIFRPFLYFDNAAKITLTGSGKLSIPLA